MNTMAVVSRTPEARDSRVPCPQCGGLVHPIAGRCKHCKINLADVRTARPAAAAALPPLALAKAPNLATTMAIGATPVAHPTHEPPIIVEQRPPLAATIIAVAPVPAREAYNPHAAGPILPTRPTGRIRSADERGWVARNWPVLVIILASIAIILAVVLMVLPKDEVDAGRPRSGAGPAPERMETNPLPSQGNNAVPPPSSSDPWAPPGGTQPTPDPAPQADPDPDDQSSIDPSDPLADPFASPRGGNGGLGGLGNSLGGAQNSAALALLGNVATRLCEKAKACSDPAVAAMCSGMSMFPVHPMPQNCPQASRCLEILDQIDVCDGSAQSITGTNFSSLMMRTTECVDAITSC